MKKAKVEAVLGAYKKLGINPEEHKFDGVSIRLNMLNMEHVKLANIEDLVPNGGDNPHGIFFWHRPKELEDIERNNGWTLIESDFDLPTDFNCHYVAGILNGGEFTERDGAYCVKAIESMWEHEAITHYRKAEVRKPPIY